MDEQHTRFRITGLSVGFVDWQVRGPGLSEDISASWVGDPTIDPMLRAAVTMLTFKEAWLFWEPRTPEWNDVQVEFQGEPECYRLTFQEPKDGVAPFRLEKCDDDMFTPKVPYVEIGQGTVGLDQFADDLLADCAALLREWGLVGYQEQWYNSEFPTAMMLRLVEVRRGGEPNRMGFGHELADLNRIGAGLLS